MAGDCSGCGITTADGQVAVAGPVAAAWPFGPGAALPADNGLACDPTLGLYMPPPSIFTQSTRTQTGRFIHPIDNTPILLNETVLEATASSKSNSIVRFDVNGGTAGMRVGNNNWWNVYRLITTYVNGVPTTYGPSASVASVENETGGFMGVLVPVVAEAGWLTVPAGAVVKVLARYSLEYYTWSANVNNGISFQCPRLTMMMWNVPPQ